MLDPNHEYDSMNEELYLYVINRDNELCQMSSCGKRAASVHHIIFRSEKPIHCANNLVCLCSKHHDMFHHKHVPGFDKATINRKLREAIERNEARYRRNLV